MYTDLWELAEKISIIFLIFAAFQDNGNSENRSLSSFFFSSGNNKTIWRDIKNL